MLIRSLVSPNRRLSVCMAARRSAMTDWKLPWDGGCRCGRTRFRVSAPPLLAEACHCTGCQRMTASAYSLSLAVDRKSVVEGKSVSVRVDLGGSRLIKKKKKKKKNTRNQQI